jgi:hypothetical protein
VSLRTKRVIASLLMFACGGMFYKLFILGRGPLEEMGVSAPKPINWLVVMVFAAAGLLFAWAAITKPNRPSYGYGENGHWYVLSVLPVDNKPTWAMTLWLTNITLMLMNGRSGNLDPPAKQSTPRYRIRVKHSASSDIQTWFVSRENYFVIRHAAEDAAARGLVHPVSRSIRIS